MLLIGKEKTAFFHCYGALNGSTIPPFSDRSKKIPALLEMVSLFIYSPIADQKDKRVLKASGLSLKLTFKLWIVLIFNL